MPTVSGVAEEYINLGLVAVTIEGKKYELTAYAGSNPTEQTASERFERAVTLCAALVWNFYERNALLQFRSAGMETVLAPAGELVFPVLRYLALVSALPPDPRHTLITDLTSSPDLFKIIVTSQPRGTIPAAVWNSSYVVFLDEPSGS